MGVTVKRTGTLSTMKQTTAKGLKILAAGAESMIIGHIIERTQDGIDIDGKAFRPYHPDYSLIRRLTGRAASPVSLNWSGKMLNAVKAVSRQITSTSIRVTFGVLARDNRNLIASYLQRTRKWFGVTTKAQSEIAAWIQANIGTLWGEPLKTPVVERRPPPERSEAKRERGSIRREAEQELRGMQVRSDNSANRVNRTREFFNRQRTQAAEARAAARAARRNNPRR